MKQTARVTRGGSIAEISISRKSACEMCHESGSDACTACRLFTTSNEAVSRAVNGIGAEVGDIVEVESQEGTVIGLSALVFLLPVALPLAAYYLLREYIAQPVAIGIAAATFVATLAVVFFVSKAYEKRSPFIRITAVLKHDNTDNGEREAQTR